MFRPLIAIAMLILATAMSGARIRAGNPQIESENIPAPQSEVSETENKPEFG